MADWSKSMRQSFEYYMVDPGTWKDVRRLDRVKGCTIHWDSGADTLGSATIDIDDILGECYIRVYLVINQNGVTERRPLGTFLVQTPSSSFDGKVRSVSMDAYTPLLELKESKPPLGYSILKGANIMKTAYGLVADNTRAPVVQTKSSNTLYYDFVSAPDDTWMSFTKDLIANAKYSFFLDEMGRVLFLPDQDTASLQPVYTFDDSNSSILYPEISMEHDLYGIPNVVEVMYSNGADFYFAEAVNDDENSPVSTVNRGRKIIYRETSPRLVGVPTGEQIDEYARQLLRNLSTLEYTIRYTHGYCGVRMGDCVRFRYQKAGLMNIKGKVINQSIKCEPGCPVTETAVFSTKLWG